MTANKFKTSNYWIIGKHAVNAALNNKRRAKYRLCITPENQEKININILELKPEIMSRSEISKLTDNDFHQGIALLTKPLEKQNLNSYLKKNNKKSLNFISKGDDYQVLFTSSKKNRIYIKKLAKRINLKITKIGTATNIYKQRKIINHKKYLKSLNYQGYSHKF